MPAHDRSPRRDALLVGGAHAVLALYFWAGRGVTIVHDFGPDPWSWFWQNIPADLLRDRALESLWWLHAQPPLWNALAALLIKVFGSAHMQVLQALNIGLGVGLSVLVLHLVSRQTGSRRWGIAAGLAVALHPSLFLYEAYALYTVLVAFLIVLAARLLQMDAEAGESWWPLVGFVAAVATLVLTRSLYHLVVLLAAVPFALLLRGRPPGRQAAVLALLVLVPTGWYAKNAAQQGFFGGSSWYGMGLWKTALFQQDAEVLNRALTDGVLDPVVAVVPFSPPDAYRELGYVRESDVPLLGRNDFHNINVPAISEAYQRSAVALIRRTPSRYLANVIVGYGNFSAPSSDFGHLTPNKERMGIYGRLDRWLLLRPLIEWVEHRLEAGQYYGSLYYFLLPAVLMIYLFQVTRGVRSITSVSDRVRRDAALVFLAMITVYTVIIGCTMELGENVRFKFLVEPAFLALAFVVCHRLVSSWWTAADSPSAQAEEPAG